MSILPRPVPSAVFSSQRAPQGNKYHNSLMKAILQGLVWKFILRSIKWLKCTKTAIKVYITHKKLCLCCFLTVSCPINAILASFNVLVSQLLRKIHPCHWLSVGCCDSGPPVRAPDQSNLLEMSESLGEDNKTEDNQVLFFLASLRLKCFSGKSLGPR